MKTLKCTIQCGYREGGRERIRDELTKLKEGLEDEKLSLSEDRIKLQIFKQELKQREKAIEAMRYEYIKATSNDVRQYSNQANDLTHYQLKKKEGQEERLYPMTSLQQSPPAPSASKTQYYGAAGV